MTTTTRIRPCGEAALLLECADLAEAVQLAGRVGRLRPEAVDVVAAARTVLVTARGREALPGLRRRVEELLAEGPPPTPYPPTPYPPTPDPLPGDRIRYPGAGSGSGGGVADPGDAGADGDADAGADGDAGAGPGGVVEVILDVRYDGPDLSAVADLAGLSVEAFVRTHTSITWRAAFGGFAPGFAYLVDERELGTRERGGGADPRPLPTVPRLPTPRPRVPAGSVGLADRFCAVYPGVSPGGWQLVGTTDARLWDVDRDRPALITPGTTVRFRDVGCADSPSSSADPGGADSGDPGAHR
ncbi:MAG: allophanate hydrolase subunit 1 [Dietzia sp.]